MNHVVLIGDLGAAPETGANDEVRYARFSLATHLAHRNKAGLLLERTDWHRVVAFGKVAESLERLQKGDRVAVTGRLQTGTYQKDGEARRRVEIVASEVQFLHVGNGEQENG